MIILPIQLNCFRIPDVETNPNIISTLLYIYIIIYIYTLIVLQKNGGIYIDFPVWMIGTYLTSKSLYMCFLP